MEYVLPAILVLGVILLVIAWLMVIIAGFRNHPVTGLVALVPGLNWLIMPSIWHRAGAWAITGLVGFVIAAGAWFFGGADQLTRHTKALTAQVALPGSPVVPTASAATTPAAVSPAPASTATTPATETVTVPIPQAAHAGNASAPAQVAQQAATTPLTLPAASTTTTPAKPEVDANKPAPPLAPVQDLPSAALYQLVFEDIKLDQLKNSQGKYVRLMQADGHKREGKIQSVNGEEIMLEERLEKGSATLPIKLATIRHAAVMTKKQGK